MNGHPLNPHRLSRPILFIHLDLLDLCQSPQTLVPQQLPKYGVQPVQVRCGGEGDEKLAAVGVGPFVGHADDAAIVVPQPRSDLIVEGPSPDGATALGIIRGIGMRRSTRLSHESRDDTVEGRAVVVIGGAEGKEILIGRDLVSGGYCGGEQGKDAGHRGREVRRKAIGAAVQSRGGATIRYPYLSRFGDALAKNLDLEVPESCVQRYGHGGRVKCRLGPMACLKLQEECDWILPIDGQRGSQKIVSRLLTSGTGHLGISSRSLRQVPGSPAAALPLTKAEKRFQVNQLREC
jgi:hypothetical protein